MYAVGIATGRSYSPAGALVCAALYLIGAAGLRESSALLFACALALGGQIIYLRSFAPAAFLIKVTLPLAVPLLLIHGVLNPQFPADRAIWSGVPIRTEGFTFATVISSRLLIAAAAMSIWRYTKGTEVIGFCNRLGLPPLFITGIAVSIASVALVQRKANAVYLAQQARGMRLRGSLLRRALSLPKLVIPVAVATIVEGSERGAVIESRGLGSGKWQLDDWYSPPKGRQLFGEVASAMIILAAFIIR